MNNEDALLLQGVFIFHATFITAMRIHPCQDLSPHWRNALSFIVEGILEGIIFPVLLIGLYAVFYWVGKLLLPLVTLGNVISDRFDAEITPWTFLMLPQDDVWMTSPDLTALFGLTVSLIVTIAIVAVQYV